MNDNPEITIFVCGSKCEHVFDGPSQLLFDDEGYVTGESATCSKCGALAINVALMELP